MQQKYEMRGEKTTSPAGHGQSGNARRFRQWLQPPNIWTLGRSLEVPAAMRALERSNRFYHHRRRRRWRGGTGRSRTICRRSTSFPANERPRVEIASTYLRRDEVTAIYATPAPPCGGLETVICLAGGEGSGRISLHGRDRGSDEVTASRRHRRRNSLKGNRSRADICLELYRLSYPSRGWDSNPHHQVPNEVTALYTTFTAPPERRDLLSNIVVASCNKKSLAGEE